MGNFEVIVLEWSLIIYIDFGLHNKVHFFSLQMYACLSTMSKFQCVKNKENQKLIQQMQSGEREKVLRSKKNLWSRKCNEK
jgi:hypothetical protein